MNNVKLKEEITSLKEVLEVMPKNNKKNILKYLEYLKIKREEYDHLFQEIENEIKNRASRLMPKDIEDKCIDDIDFKEKMNLLNHYSTPFEKSGLDVYLFEIRHFYQDDFASLNEDIKKTILLFREHGIILSSSSFCYHPYVFSYMDCFFKNMDNLESDSLRNVFEKLYWKCSNIIFYIALNFWYLYYQNEKKFLSYYLKKREALLENCSIESIRSTYQKLYYRTEFFMEKRDFLVHEFLEGRYDIKEYAPDKVKSNRFSLMEEDNFNNVIQLYYSLLEYQFYLNHKFLIDHFLKIYQDRDKYRGEYKNALKEIFRKEKKLRQLNRKYFFFNKRKWGKKSDMLMMKINEMVEELREKYEGLDEKKILEMISSFDVKTSYYDVFWFMLSFYPYTRELIQTEYDEMGNEEIRKYMDSAEMMLISYPFHLMSNISILENKDIPLIICDRYQLLKFKLKKEDIESNLEGVISLVEKVLMSFRMEEVGVSYEEISFLDRVKKLEIL